MGSAGENSDLGGLLRSALRERLEPAGWQLVLERDADRESLASFIKPLDGAFAATAEVLVHAEHRVALVVGDVLVGVAYEPLRGLWYLLGDLFRLSLLRTSARSDECVQLIDEIDWDEEEDGEDRDSVFIRVGSESEVPAAAEVISGVVDVRGVEFAQRRADVDVLVREFADPDDPEFVDIRVPALLAAAGRFEEARRVLDRWQPAPELLQARQRRTARQVRRWIDSGGDLALLPGSPPPREHIAQPPQKSFSERAQEAKQQQAAVAHVRAQGSGMERDHLRGMLEQELGRRGVGESPLWIETTLDHLWDSPAEQVRGSVGGLLALGRAGFQLAKALHDPSTIRPRRPPPWLDPPDHALYPLPETGRWIRVRLDEHAVDWLNRAHSDGRATRRG